MQLYAKSDPRSVGLSCLISRLDIYAYARMQRNVTYSNDSFASFLRSSATNFWRLELLTEDTDTMEKDPWKWEDLDFLEYSLRASYIIVAVWNSMKLGSELLSFDLCTS